MLSLELRDKVRLWHRFPFLFWQMTFQLKKKDTPEIRPNTRVIIHEERNRDLVMACSGRDRQGSLGRKPDSASARGPGQSLRVSAPQGLHPAGGS